jgi:hypothetical protein
MLSLSWGFPGGEKGGEDISNNEGLTNKGIRIEEPPIHHQSLQLQQRKDSEDNHTNYEFGRGGWYRYIYIGWWWTESE